MFNRTSVFHWLSHIVLNNPSPNPPLFLAIRRLSKASSDPSQSFAVTYLKDKLGFSPESALAAVNGSNLAFKTPDRPDSVIAFLEKHGFSKTQIKRIITIRPGMLYYDADKSLLPKLEFFRSKGASSSELNRLLSYNPRFLSRSLEKQTIPCFDQLSKLLQSDSKAVKAIKRYPLLITCKLDTYLLPNINVLLDNGVPESNIILMFLNQPRCFVAKTDRFKGIVEEVKEMGFNPLLIKFLQAVIILKKVTKPALDKKFDVYKKWGWSEPEIWEAFRRYPSVMESSAEKIMTIMDFLVNEMGFESSFIAKHPSLFARSFEKRILPRGLFAQDLLSKGLIKNFEFSLFHSSEKVFIQRFVNRYECEHPELLMLYNEKLNLAIGGKYRSASEEKFMAIMWWMGGNGDDGNLRFEDQIEKTDEF
ncbi:hypothetical protein PTKIN_Ptkin09bG0023200 [Pterospermum kingtungense]